ncbi:MULTISPECIES: RnfH family protein [unclassified Oceanobacter]|jgi:putative ubiquitin-RnfH superfamily antitoxin RatB of RatAB toxin-antitoxin module|uniref:RnfH family protein n=1 Tax=unclassified Oceanobacter TaxID=2620260 RepID=UPI0026E18153|nr:MULTISPECIES: RnfH family protein [unclassified Oceanobacter]MDO6683705.1 RnfH family protein [Oceanobacter sp. 5_MG-2023]MDP2507229.1 RnfH family protein [Oceanobacter sp. 3_MG-2023]MDP2549406.1 RnfH family protein [Oceanobacter sp. 4_MG-2023]MDP2608322.1 RnfH family protein [Oceanobacter sp. 1_MG-2023]MDP2612207.1 RnfH family protein [Oceanobacter sp. 2_MG-2023]
MHISVVYAIGNNQPWIELDVEEPCLLADAVAQSGLLEHYPDINLEQQRVGIFGKLAKPDTPLKNGDRVEVYRPIIRNLDDDDDEDD